MDTVFVPRGARLSQLDWYEGPLTPRQVVMIAILEPCEKQVDSVLDAVRTADDTAGGTVKLEPIWFENSLWVSGRCSHEL